MTENQYTDLVAGYHTEQPKFKQWIYELTQPVAEATERLAKLPVREFDVDTATGVCLDAVGQRVGFMRKAHLPIANTFFALDDVDGVGFDIGVWHVLGQAIDFVTPLDDDTFRACIKAKIKANHWDGRFITWRSLFKAFFDAFDVPDSAWSLSESKMQCNLRVSESATPVVAMELLKRRIVNLCPAGVNFVLTETA